MAGPNPNFASAWSQIGKAIWPIHQLDLFANSNTPNLLDMLDDLATNQDGVYTSTYEARIRALIAGGVSSPLSPAAVRSAFTPGLRELADIINSDATDPVEILADLRVYMTDNSQTINSLNITHGTPAADGTSHGGSGNTGDFVINRLTVDENGDELSTSPEVKYAEVVQDQNSGTREWEEVLRFYGAPVRQFPLEFAGSGTLASGVQFAHGGANSAGAWLANPSFDQGTHTDNTALAATTSVTSWTVTTAADWKSQSGATYNYRGYPGAPSTQYGLECIADDAITQVLQTTKPQRDYGAAPMYLQVSYMRKASATGNLTIALGAQSSTAVIGSATNDQWATLRLAIGTKNWSNNFAQDGLAVTITVDTLAVGTVVIDDVILVPFTQVDGTWYAPVGGSGNSVTPPEVLDRFTWTDSHADTSVLAYWLWRGFGPNGWLPSTTGGTETIADPS